MTLKDTINRVIKDMIVTTKIDMIMEGGNMKSRNKKVINIKRINHMFMNDNIILKSLQQEVGMKRDSIIIQREKEGDMIKEIKNKEDLDPETRITITKAETMTFE